MRHRACDIDRREVTLLTAHVLHKPYEHVLAHPDQPISVKQRRTIERLIQGRASGIPLAYLTGTKWFYANAFSVGPGILIPRPETELLVDTVLKMLPSTFSGTIVDVGTGSGCIALSLAALFPRARFFATERSRRALRYAKQNAKSLGCQRRVSFLNGDLLTPLQRKKIVPDIIVANLPYATPQEYNAVRHEPQSAIVGGFDGMSLIRRFFLQLKRYRFRIPCILEIDPRRRSAVAALAIRALPKSVITTKKDLAGRYRAIVIEPQPVVSGTN
ncbi:MAG: peptide chain release factor N(5)-glutamine methyltransferase [Candidatus Kerfeldbacteria bacterium]